MNTRTCEACGQSIDRDKIYADMCPNCSKMAYMLDGQRINIQKFIQANEFEFSEIACIRKLEVGQQIRYGGGAAAEFILKRIA